MQTQHTEGFATRTPLLPKLRIAYDSPLSSWPIALFTVLIVTLVTQAGPVPHDNEGAYLLQLYRTWHPDFLAEDWTFANAGSEHWLFNHMIGFVTLFMPLRMVAWVGRASCWVLSSAILLRLLKRLGLAPWQAALAIVTWIAVGQSLLGGEWMLGGFEAKTVAYVFLLAGVLKATENKVCVSALLVGLSFSFHPSVGALGGLATFIGISAAHPRINTVLRFGLVAAVAAVPGLIAILPVAFADSASEADAAYLLTTRLPYMNPLSWAKTAIGALFLTFAFNVWYAWSRRRLNVWRGVLGFQIGLVLPFAVGLVAGLTGAYRFLLYFPFRLFPLFTPLLFFALLAHSIGPSVRRRIHTPLFLAGLLVLASLPNPVHGLYRQVEAMHSIRSQRHNNDSLRLAYKWSAKHLPANAVVLAPPWDRNVWYFLKRPIVVSHRYFPYGNLSEWRERSRRVFGEFPPSFSSTEIYQHIQIRYASHSADEIIDLRKQYQFDFLITRSDYPFEAVYRSGTYTVYDLRNPDRA